MSRLTHEVYSPEDFFNHQTLELTFRLLRNNSPGLANAIKKTLDHIQIVPYENLYASHTGEMHFNAQLIELLNPHTVGKIVSTLTDIGQRALDQKDLPAEHLTMLRNLIDDWVQLTEWMLRRNDANKAGIA